MAVIDGVFVNSTTGKATNGATAKLWQASAFSAPPIKNEALPGSGQVGIAVTTGTAHGSDGAYRFTGVATGDYYVSIEYNGNIGWESASAAITDPLLISHSTIDQLDSDDHPQYTRVTDGGKEALATDATVSGAKTIDLADGNVHQLTLTGNATLTFTGATNAKGCSFVLILLQDGVGGRTVTWPGSVQWPSGLAPVLATAGGGVDIISFLSSDGGSNWYGAYTSPTDNVALGQIGYAQVTTMQGSITTEVDLTGLSVTVDVGVARRIRITGQAHLESTNAADVLGLDIQEGATNLFIGRWTNGTAGQRESRMSSVVLTPTSGAHTYKLTGLRSGAGTATIGGITGGPAYILVEDIGPA